MIKNEVGKRIKMIRIMKGLSQEDLAFKANLDRSYITYVENAKKNVTIETLYKITQALEISLSEFFDTVEIDKKWQKEKNTLKLSLEDLHKGNVYSNKEISSIFNCSTQGGIRISLANKTITLISHSYSKLNPYQDSEISANGYFVYTGMGMRGDQVVKPTNQNGKVAYSNENGYSMYYFVSIEKNKYKFIGEVKLINNYFFEEEKDCDGNIRKVVKFPLTII